MMMMIIMTEKEEEEELPKNGKWAAASSHFTTLYKDVRDIGEFSQNQRYI
jgi:hypothetical protein